MRNVLLAAFMSLLLQATNAYALIDVQLLVGQRNGSLKTETGDADVAGTDLKAAVHLDPIPLIPVGFGVYASNATYKDTDSVKSLKGMEFGVEVTAWSPVEILGIEPYAKLGYTLVGAYEYKFNAPELFKELNVEDPSLDVKLGASGMRVAAGLKWSPIPLIALMLEVEQSNMKLSVDSIAKAVGLPDSASDVIKDADLNSLGIFLGVQVGI